MKQKLCAVSDFDADQNPKVFEVGELKLCLVKIGDDYFCIDDTCSHADFSLAEGEVDEAECAIECPKHGSLFDLKTGEALTLPATVPVKYYEVELVGDDIFVEVEG